MTSPLARVGAANAVTAVRALLVFGLATCIGSSTPTARVAWIAVIAAIAIAALDGVDGWVARRTGSASRFGAWFDMETDGVFIFVLAVLTWRWGKAGAWVLLSGLMRYLFLVAGLLRSSLRWPLTPTLRGRSIAVVQMAALIVAMAPVIPTPISNAGAAVALLLLAWSFAMDVRRLWR